MDAKTAAKIAADTQRASSLCEESLRVVMSHQSIGQAKVYASLVAEFMAASFLSVLAPLWRAFPELEPSEMREPYADPKPSLAEPSRLAIERFLADAELLVASVQNLATSTAVPIPTSALAELESAIQQIRAFLANPVFRRGAFPNETET